MNILTQKPACATLRCITRMDIVLKTRIFELCNCKYKNISELSKAMGLSVSQVYRVRRGKRRINEKFLIGAIKAFPEYDIGTLFYILRELPTINNGHHKASAQHSKNKWRAKARQG